MRGSLFGDFSRGLAEPVVIFLLIEYYIWFLRFSYRWMWLPLLGCILLSHLLRRESARVLGFRTDNLPACMRILVPFVLFTGGGVLALGVFWGTIRTIAGPQAALALAAYLPWGVFQQYLLNGYFLNRFDSVLARRQSSLVAALMFSAAHAPNWFLMSVGFVGAYVSTRFYRRYRNLYFLGLAHAVIGFLLYLVVPDSISHHLNVGPGH